jgi:hypothetical protein
MRILTFSEIETSTGGSEASYEAGRSDGEFIGKTLIGTSVAVAIYLALATA